MERRKFIKLSSATTAFSLMPYEVFSFLKAAGISSCPDVTGRKLVLIQLAGANDGINTLVPLNQYDFYANMRPTLKLGLTGANSIIPLDTTLPDENQIGLHPTLTGFKNLYDNGMMRIVQGVGYPSSNKSHFKSSDLWLSGGDGTFPNFNIQSGWIGRFLESYYPDRLHASYPLGIQLGSAENSLGFHGAVEHGLSVNISNQDVSGFYSVISGLGGQPPTNIPDSEYGELLQFLIDLDESTNSYSEAISAAFNSGANTISYPESNLADQLKTVARFITGGLETKIYLVKLTGFDTHESQVVGGASHTGIHANLLKELSDAVNAFIADLNNQGRGEDVLAMTFSEFGRKVQENSNLGTDHGEVAPMFLFGKTVTPGISGVNVNLSEAHEENNYQVESVQSDYRSVFSTVLQDWLGARNGILDSAFYDHNLERGFGGLKLPGIISPQSLVPEYCYNGEIRTAKIVVYPNPCSEFVSIMSPNENPIYSVGLISITGAVLATAKNTTPDQTVMTLDTRGLATGVYHLRIETKKETVVKKLLVSR